MVITPVPLKKQIFLRITLEIRKKIKIKKHFSQKTIIGYNLQKLALDAIQYAPIYLSDTGNIFHPVKGQATSFIEPTKHRSTPSTISFSFILRRCSKYPSAVQFHTNEDIIIWTFLRKNEGSHVNHFACFRMNFCIVSGAYMILIYFVGADKKFL